MLWLAASLLDVFASVLGVLLCLTGLALGFMGLCSAVEGTVKRGALGLLIGVALLAGGLHLTGFF